VSTPQDPFTPPEPGPPVYGQPPAYGQAPPPYGQPAGYGQPAPGAWQGPPLASWGQRVGAWLIDVLLYFGILLAAAILAAVVGQASGSLGGVVLGLGYVAAFAFVIWQLVVQGQTGATIGKRRLGLRLLRERDGRVIGPWLSIARQILHIVDSMPFMLGYLWPLWDPKRQTFADKIVKTVVIRS
jgi:uncharacterized RDD family membrane protein YckC